MVGLSIRVRVGYSKYENLEVGVQIRVLI
jgi:hypothetical protein